MFGIGLGTAQRSFIAFLSLHVVGCNPHAMPPEGEYEDKGLRDARWSDDIYVDIHTHIACFGSPERNPGCYAGQQLRRSFKYRLYPRVFGLDGDDYERVSATEYQMTSPMGDYFVFKHLHDLLVQNNGFKQSVVLAMDQMYDEHGEAHPEHTEYHVSNEFVIEGLRQIRETDWYQDTFLFGASVHPFRNDALEALEHAKAHGAVLVKLIAPTHQFHPDGQGHSEATKEKLRLFYEKLKELELPLLIHADEEYSFSDSNNEYAGVYKLKWALEIGVTVIVAHAGSRGSSLVPSDAFDAPVIPTAGLPFDLADDLRYLCQLNDDEIHVLDNQDQLICMMHRYPNLYADISVLPSAPLVTACQTPRRGKLRDLVDGFFFEAFPHRVLWGSDYPLNHWSLNAYQCVRGLDFARFRRNDINVWDAIRAEKYFQRAALLGLGVGVPEDAFFNTERFFRATAEQRRTGRIPGDTYGTSHL